MNALLTTIVMLAIVDGAFAGCALPDAPPPPRPLRLVSFNVLHGGLTSELWGDGDRLEDRLTATTEGLRALDADVIGLQEASRGWRRGNVAQRIGAALGFHTVDAGATSRLFGGGLLGFLSAFVLAFDEGPAIVSRYPITGSTTWLLAQCHTFYRRVLLCAEVCTPWGPVEVCSTHLNGTACQASSVDAHLRTLPAGAPVVLTGDLNATEDTDGLRLLRERSRLIDTFRVANPSMPGFTDDQELDEAVSTVAERADYVLVAPGSQRSSRVVASHIVLDRPAHTDDGDLLWTSDHYGVLSDVVLFGPVVGKPALDRPGTVDAPARGATRRSAAAATARTCTDGARSCSSHAAGTPASRQPRRSDGPLQRGASAAGESGLVACRGCRETTATRGDARGPGAVAFGTPPCCPTAVESRSRSHHAQSRSRDPNGHCRRDARDIRVPGRRARARYLHVECRVSDVVPVLRAGSQVLAEAVRDAL